MTARDPKLRELLLRDPTSGDEPLDEVSDADLDAAGMLALLADEARPSDALRARLESTLRATHRFDDLEETLAQLIDLPLEAVRDLLLAIDEGSRWEPGPGAGIELLHFRGGPAVRDAVTGFVRLPRDVEFPDHEHVGDEVVMILQGSYRDSSGTVHGRGEVVRMPAGTSHSLTATGPVPLCYAAVVHRGVKIGGQLLDPDDPRA